MSEFGPVAQYYSIDVECVATGFSHNARDVAQISLVDQYERVLLNLYVKPDKPVVSYLTPLTGLTKEVLEQHGIPKDQAVHQLKQCLPPNAILVGQNIGKDIEWLGLQEGQDYVQLMDLVGLFRVWNPKFNSYSVYSQDHLARILLDWEVNETHDAVGDAIKSIRLFNLYQQVQSNENLKREMQTKLLDSTPNPSFAKQNPSFEGVCMGNRRTCTCGDAFFG